MTQSAVSGDSSDPQDGSLTSLAQDQPSLNQGLGLGAAIAIVVGNVIGAGIFLKPRSMAIECGSFPLIMFGWILAGIVCMFGALCFAELASMLPHAGGLYVYLREAYSKRVAFLFGMNEYVFGRTATNGALGTAFAGMFISLLTGIRDVDVDPWLTAVVACTAIGLLALINIIGVTWGGHVQSSTTLVKAGFLGLIAILPFVLMSGSHGFNVANYATSNPLPKLTSISAQFAAIFMAVMWAYNGWHDIAPVAEEVKDPQRNIPRSLIWGTGIIIALYVSVNLAYHGALSMEQIAHGDENTAKLMIQTVLTPYGASLSQFGIAGVMAVSMCSIFGALNSNLMLGPRIAFAMARDGIFWKPLARVHPNFRTPAVSILTQAIVSCLFVLVVTTYVVISEKPAPQPEAISMAKLPAVSSAEVPAKDQNTVGPVHPKVKKTSVFEVLTNFVVYSANVFYALCILAVFILRRRHPEWVRPYRTWGYPLVPAFYLAVMGWFLFAAFTAAPIESVVAVALMLSGLPMYAILSRSNTKVGI